MARVRTAVATVTESAGVTGGGGTPGPPRAAGWRPEPQPRLRGLGLSEAERLEPQAESLSHRDRDRHCDH